MKTFETVKDILDNTQHFHQYAADFYQQMVKRSSNQRTKMLLSYMHKHHKEVAVDLERFIEGTATGILNTWVKITLEKSPEDFFNHLSFHDDMPHEEVGALGQQVDAYLVGVFDELRSTASTDESQVIFQNLMEMEMSIKRRLSQAVNSLLREM